MSRTIAVIGLGNMGGAIAERLTAQGNRVIGVDPSSAAQDRARQAGVEIVGSVAEAVAAAEYVFSSLPNPPIVREVWLDGGELAALPAGKTFVELSTIDPDTMILLRDRAPEGVRVVDCPVSGGPEQARSGSLSLIVGARAEDFEFVKPLLEQFGATVHHAGDVGAGKAVKLVNNMMSMTNVLVAAEAFAVGLAYGLDAKRLYDILSVSGGTSNQFTKRFPRAIAGNYDPGFALSLGTKDLTLALAFARSVGVPTPAAAMSRELYALAESNGLGEEDHVALLKMYNSWARGKR